MPEKEKHFRKFQESLQWATKSMDQYYFKIAMAKSRGHFLEKESIAMNFIIYLD
jgi:hypothetical protein